MFGRVILKSNPTPFISIAMSSTASELDVMPGTVYDSLTKEVIAKPGEPFRFIILQFAMVWKLFKTDENGKMKVKYAYEIDGILPRVWNDGTPVLPGEVEFSQDAQGKSIQPTATNSLDFMVVPEHEIMAVSKKEKEEPTVYNLSFMMTSKQMKEVVEKAISEIDNAESRIRAAGLSKEYNALFSAKSVKTTAFSKKTNKDETWYHFSNLKLETVKDDAVVADICEPKMEAVVNLIKDFELNPAYKTRNVQVEAPKNTSNVTSPAPTYQAETVVTNPEPEY